MLSSKDYTVGWICNIITEYVAAQAVLDEEHERPEDVSPNDSNSYTLGKIGKHNVVMAVLPSGDVNTSSAAIVATHMLRSFPNIAFFLTVVIGSGVPSSHHDIRLGDVVVGVPHNGEGGVYQFDLGKAIQDEEFCVTGLSRVSPPILRTAVNELIARYESKGQQLEGLINGILETKPRLQSKYKRPHPSLDRLCYSFVTHLKDEPDCSCRGYGDNSSTVVPRFERTEEEDNPAIHYGLIASGNQVVKDALTRDKLGATKGVLCFDKGCAGVMNHFPCLVIVGICDYADTHDYRVWQGCAAMAAAAYAKDLLYQIPPSKIEAEKKFGYLLSNQADEVSTTSITGSSSLHEDIFDSDHPHRAHDHSTEFVISEHREPLLTLSREEEAGIKFSETVPTITTWREAVFDSAEVMSVTDTVVAYVALRGLFARVLICISQSAADNWFTHRDLMGKVNRFFIQYRRKPTPKKEIVKIAILDTGIDLDHPELKPFRDDRITGGCCRDFVNPGESPIRDSTGHGTHCAHLILKVCQTARLYVARVFETDMGDEGAVERIPEAIEWAVSCGVDIIVMCFAFTRFHYTIHKAICKAKGQQDMLIFAAASNNKHDLENPVGFPACMDEVIRVNSCTHKGLQSSFSPACDSEGSSLSIIGEELQAAFPLAKNGNEPLKRMTGTSMATAILAGTAGLVLEFSRMERKSGPSIQHHDRLLLTKGMGAVLRGCMAGDKPPQPPRYCYIKPWLLFAPENSRENVVHRISEELRKCMA